MPSIRFDRITPNLDTGRIATEETGASYEFATTPTLNAGGFWREEGSSREGRGFRYPVRLYPWTEIRAWTRHECYGSPGCVRSFLGSCVRACSTRACHDRNGLSVSLSLLRFPSVNRLHEPRDPIPLSGAPPLGQTERPRSIYLVHGSRHRKLALCLSVRTRSPPPFPSNPAQL